MNISNQPVLVSVVMITYAHEAYLEKAILGVLNQKFDFNFELIVADDSSPDNTYKLVSNIKKNHTKGHLIKYTKHSENKGMQKNFIWALEQANGEFIAICEGDDYWIDVNKLSIQLNFMIKGDLDLSFHYGYCVDEHGLEVYKHNLPENTTTFDNLLIRWPLTASIVFRRSQLFSYEFYNLFLNTWSGDQMLMLLLADNGKIGIVHKFMCNHIVHNYGATHNTKKDLWILNRIESLKTLNKLTKNDHSRSIKHALKMLYFHYAESHTSSFILKLRFIFKAITVLPLSLFNFKELKELLYFCKCVYFRNTN